MHLMDPSKRHSFHIPNKILSFSWIFLVLVFFLLLIPSRTHAACSVTYYGYADSHGNLPEENTVSFPDAVSCSDPAIRADYEEVRETGVSNGVFIFDTFWDGNNASSALCRCSNPDGTSDSRNLVAQEVVDRRIAGSSVRSGGDIPFGDCFTILSEGKLASLNVGNCVGRFAHGAFTLSGLAMAGAGTAFDYLLNFGIRPDVIAQPFVETAWENIRDLVNAAFIFVILFIAIATILNIQNGKYSAKSLLIGVIVYFSN